MQIGDQSTHACKHMFPSLLSIVRVPSQHLRQREREKASEMGFVIGCSKVGETEFDLQWIY